MTCEYQATPSASNKAPAGAPPGFNLTPAIIPPGFLYQCARILSKWYVPEYEPQSVSLPYLVAILLHRPGAELDADLLGTVAGWLLEHGMVRSINADFEIVMTADAVQACFDLLEANATKEGDGATSP